ncbi:mono [ADP-ribose] polymerase PARP16-like [Asbolus verrucosus]|uniref:Mono [ADP-ribose] polymerase PARP16-like n=1 Tax=Asbolus verrucosus TaxID=1661398 RepID=A0A482WBZ2_ASBVE|nr:mono [ADP-ribose] polymerase PARP16-like [Asbolus verrucosus]
MEFDEERILRIEESEENFSDITFVTSYSVDKNDHQSSFKIDKLLEEIKKNVWGCDLILCFFIAALQSYRADRCLRPFPPLHINEDGKDFNALRNTCDSIPPLNAILIEPNKCSQENKVPFPSKFSGVYKPHFVFEVCYHEKIELMWKKRQDGRKTILAYHGSAVDNFYSILKVGLQQHFSFEKEVLFGNGIYLSNELSVSAHYAPFGQTWIPKTREDQLIKIVWVKFLKNTLL